MEPLFLEGNLTWEKDSCLQWWQQATLQSSRLRTGRYALRGRAWIVTIPFPEKGRVRAPAQLHSSTCACICATASSTRILLQLRSALRFATILVVAGIKWPTLTSSFCCLLTAIITTGDKTENPWLAKNQGVRSLHPYSWPYLFRDCRVRFFIRWSWCHCHRSMYCDLTPWLPVSHQASERYWNKDLINMAWFRKDEGH